MFYYKYIYSKKLKNKTFEAFYIKELLVYYINIPNFVFELFFDYNLIKIQLKMENIVFNMFSNITNTLTHTPKDFVNLENFDINTTNQSSEDVREAIIYFSQFQPKKIFEDDKIINKSKVDEVDEVDEIEEIREVQEFEEIREVQEIEEVGELEEDTILYYQQEDNIIRIPYRKIFSPYLSEDVENCILECKEVNMGEYSRLETIDDKYSLVLLTNQMGIGWYSSFQLREQEKNKWISDSRLIQVVSNPYYLRNMKINLFGRDFDFEVEDEKLYLSNNKNKTDNEKVSLECFRGKTLNTFLQILMNDENVPYLESLDKLSVALIPKNSLFKITGFNGIEVIQIFKLNEWKQF
jgi:hypothetical protein